MKEIKKNLREKATYAGVHILADFWHGKKIENPKSIRAILLQAVKVSGNTPLKTIVHKFYPQGVTGLILLAESHIAVHTWPELDYIAIDIFTCGAETNPDKALSYLRKIIKPKREMVKKIKRGVSLLKEDEIHV